MEVQGGIKAACGGSDHEQPMVGSCLVCIRPEHEGGVNHTHADPFTQLC